MTDDMLLSAFEGGTLAPADFHHRDHVRLTWLLLDRYDRAATEQRLLDGLRALARRAGKPDRFDATLTRRWIAAIDAARRELPAGTSFETLTRRRPDLLDAKPVRATA
jgi:hypothetical protein